MNTTHDCIYEVVDYHKRPVIYQSMKELLAHHERTGWNKSMVVRPELYGQPRIKGYVGGMYGGVRNGQTIIRYECVKEYSTYD